MKNLLICISLLLFFSSCIKLDGTMTIYQKMKVKSGNSNTILFAGFYQTSITVNKTKLKFKFSNNKHKGKFTLKLKNKIPKQDGDFLLKANDINQDFDIKGNLKTIISNGPRQSGRESCTFQERRTVCQINSQGQRICWDEMVNVNGYQYVDFHNQFTKRILKFSFIKPTIKAADFDTKGTQTDKVYDYRGYCQRGY